MLTAFCDGKAWVRIDDDWFFINKKGKKMKDTKYCHNGFCLVKENEKRGISNKKNEIIIPADYDNIIF